MPKGWRGRGSKAKGKAGFTVNDREDGLIDSAGIYSSTTHSFMCGIHEYALLVLIKQEIEY